MRCYICDASLADPKIHPDIGKVEPCDFCMEIVEDTLAGYKDRPSVDEDELGQFPLPFPLEFPDAPWIKEE